MYVVTFYSFKGGVGRSLALMNCATELATKGQKILLVDFDLEAPGLETFDLLRHSPKTKGIVDYVNEYLNSKTVPSIDQFVSKISLNSESGGELWFLPSGERNRNYVKKLNAIDWRELYEQRDGYLLFENLKGQWKEHINPNYVFIDSRTGYTDVGQICTRQLPDAIVFLFFPNEQNLNGLSTIIQWVTDEDVKIATNFVMSNVPDIDDEEQILKRWSDRFRKKLNYPEPELRVHHYPSLSLLNQEIFTLTRPQSRLASEYRILVQNIQKQNIEDRDGVLILIDELRQQLIKPDEHEFGQIIDIYSEDFEVIDKVVSIWEKQGKFEQANNLLTKILGGHHDHFNLLIRKLRLSSILGLTDDATQIATRLTKISGVSDSNLTEIVRVLRRESPKLLDSISSWPSVQQLGQSELLNFVQKISLDRGLLAICEQVLKNSTKSGQIYKDESFFIQIQLILIGQRKFSEALKFIEKSIDKIGPVIAFKFNRAMAVWGGSGKKPYVDFNSVIELHESKTQSRYTANYFQCISLAYFVVGNTEIAIKCLEKSKRKMTRYPYVNEFSYWSYLTRNPTVYLQELNQQEKMIRGKNSVPEIISPYSPTK